MSKYLMLISIIAVTLISCGDDPNNDEIIPLEGYHSLTAIRCECFPIEIIPFQQQWKFDFDNSELTVAVTGTMEKQQILESAVYKFKLIDTTSSWVGSTAMLQLDDRSFFFKRVMDGIQLSDPEASNDNGSYYDFVEN